MWTTFTLFQHTEIASVNIEFAKSKNKLVTTIYPKKLLECRIKNDKREMN